jgi:NAD(P)-dependent dehydrogenase (short-subunit alcohol dehydrogenase family)
MSAPTSKVLVLITGANQGIGLATAKQLANSDKYHIIITTRSLANAEAAVKELGASATDPAALTPLVLDVRDDASIEAAAASVQSQFGRLDILINNAGLGQPQSPQSSIRESFRQVFEVNVFGLMAVTEAFLPLLRASTYHDRRIVNLTSGLGLTTMAGKKGYAFNANAWYAPDYRSSKAAVNMITAAMSVKLAEEGIAVVAVAPGMCRTRFTGGQGRKEASDGAKVVVRAATEGEAEEISGKYIADEAHDGW